MRENVEQLRSIAHAPSEGKPIYGTEQLGRIVLHCSKRL
jgi:hypothetical protein